jgi:hypothetical protein
MSDDKRPGGLTALAVLNFVFSAVELIGALGFAALPMLQQGPGLNDAQRTQLEAMTSLGTGLLAALAAGGAICGVLLIVSGVGYLKQKRLLGRTMGNTYAVFSIATAVPAALWIPAQLGGGFSLSTILSLVYPLLTLLLLNLTFKEDLVN